MAPSVFREAASGRKHPRVLFYGVLVLVLVASLNNSSVAARRLAEPRQPADAADELADSLTPEYSHPDGGTTLKIEPADGVRASNGELELEAMAGGGAHATAVK